ncbi:MAG: vWA domain-containing protein [Adhaeribacter sp.]
MILRQTSLSGNIVQFCRYLRHTGFALSAEEEATALKSLSFIDYQSKTVFRLALKAVLCRSKIQLDEFDALFSEYWQEITKAVDAKEKSKPASGAKLGTNPPSFQALKAWLNGNNHPEIEQTSAYSIHQNLSRQDFSQVPADDLAEMMKIIKALSRRLAAQASRRYEKTNQIKQPDLRRTLRKNIRLGGELMDIAFRKPTHNRLKLVVLCDVSKSMELYTAFLLQFIYSFGQVYRRLETFAFSTSLHCITSLLKQHDFAQALQALSAQNYGLQGGTKIGESLHTFVTDYAARLLDKRTIVLILSDGWDTGDIQLLEQSMKTLQEKAKKVIWLNPLAGYAGYRPEVIGMQTAMPYINVLAPVHNVASLRKLGKCL